jgi:hypothetical protein
MPTATVNDSLERGNAGIDRCDSVNWIAHETGICTTGFVWSCKRDANGNRKEESVKCIVILCVYVRSFC